MKTDIDKLHEKALGNLIGRGTGKTFLKCHEIMAAIEMDHELIICIIKYYIDINYISRMLHEVSEDHDIILKRTNKFEFHTDNSRILFIPVSQLNERLRGLGDHTIIDMVDY
jgi:hypothetical protein